MIEIFWVLRIAGEFVNLAVLICVLVLIGAVRDLTYSVRDLNDEIKRRRG